MTEWPHEVSALTQQEILEHVRDARWQEFRLSLKGLSTQDKLRRLDEYMTLHRQRAPVQGGFNKELARPHVVRVDNYINALLRGGQLVRRGDRIYVQR